MKRGISWKAIFIGVISPQIMAAAVGIGHVMFLRAYCFWHPDAADINDMVKLEQRLLDSSAFDISIILYLTDILLWVIGGYFGGKIAKTRYLAHGLIIGIFCLITDEAMNAMPMPIHRVHFHDELFGSVLFTLIIPATVLGSYLAKAIRKPETNGLL
jgi:hypothetical protein